MTSRRYLNDKADTKDFIRSFLMALPYSVVALIVFIVYSAAPVLDFITSPNSIQTIRETGVISYFGESYIFDGETIQMGMVCCGILTAVMLFRFMFSKSSVNVFFSMGITRSRLYLNRVLAAILSMLLAVIIPFGITLIANIATFGSSKHIFNVFFYEVLTLFTSGLAGLSIGAFACTISGSIIEAVITSGATAFAPLLLCYSVSGLKYSLLNGYVSSNNVDKLDHYSKILSPFTFVTDLNLDRYNKEHYSSMLNKYSDMLSGREVPKDMAVDFSVFAPIICWLIASMVFIAIGFALMNRRKAENANSFGKFYVSCAINGITVYSVAFLFLGEVLFSEYTYSESIFFHKIVPLIAIAFVALFIAFFLSELIMRRKMKAVIHQLPVFAFMFAITIISVVFVSTEYFGTYNKLPDTNEIKLVSMSINDPLGTFDYLIYSYSAYDYEKGEGYSSKTAEDIKLVTDVFNGVKSNSYNAGMKSGDVAMIGSYYYHFQIVLKNGDIMERRFDIRDPELIDKIERQVYDSAYFKNYLKALLIDNPVVETTPTDAENDEYYDHYQDYYYDGFERGKYKTNEWYCVNGSSMFSGYKPSEENFVAPPVEDSEGLCKALYDDLIKLPYDKLYRNTSRPVAVLAIDCTSAYSLKENYCSYYGYMERELNYISDDYYMEEYKISPEEFNKKYDTGVAYGLIYVYPEMTNTIKFLKDSGYEIMPFNAKVKEVYYAESKVSLTLASASALKKIDKKSINSRVYYNGYIPDYDSNIFNFNDSFNFSYYTTYFTYADDSALSSDSSYKISIGEMFNKIIELSDVKFIKVADQKKAEQIVSKCVPFYADTAKDNGRYIYIVYDNGVICEEYLPSQNMSVIGVVK